MINLKGEKFGRLEVLESVGTADKEGRIWKCRCSCPKGSIIYATTKRLRDGSKISCGCISAERRRNSYIYEPFEDCKAWDGENCVGLNELTCAKYGKCKFYKPKEKEKV